MPLDVLKQLLAVDNWTNLERFALDLATLLFILVCFEVNLHVYMVALSFGSISIRNNSFRACVICSLFCMCRLFAAVSTTLSIFLLLNLPARQFLALKTEMEGSW